jgi:hypothetical protein
MDGAVDDGPGGPARERHPVAAPALRAKRSAANTCCPRRVASTAAVTFACSKATKYQYTHAPRRGFARS